MTRWLGAAALAVAMVLGAGAQVARGEFADARVLAPFPAEPGFPEGIAVRDGRVYAAGAATFGTTGSGPSTVVVYDRATGAMLARHDVPGENTLAEHANSSIAFDAAGRLHVLNTQLGTYRLIPETGVVQPYAPPFPNLPICKPLVAVKPCSPTLVNLPPLANDIAFAADGSAYVSDSMQATIWRIPPGGGTPEPWFQDRRFASAYVGVNGLRIDPAGTRVYVTVTADQQGRASVYSLPLTAAPSASDLALFHRFAAGDLPDGIAFGAAGDLYVAMASPLGPGIAILRPDGTERGRLGNPPGSPTAPFDGPANLAFDGAGHVLVTNHAPLTGLVLRRFSIAEADVEDPGAPLFAP